MYSLVHWRTEILGGRNGRRSAMLFVAALTSSLFVPISPARAGNPFAAGNLLVQSQAPGSISYQITEYTLTGALVQTLNPEQPPGQTDVFQPRDLIVGTDGLLRLYNGTGDPFLSTFDSAAGSWSHVTHPGWSTVNNLSYGGIAQFGDIVFVTDMATFGEPADQEKGIVAFDIGLGTSTRFATSIEPIDLTLGLDSRLWALAGGTAFAYDPATFQFLGSVSLSGASGDARAIAVGPGGEFFVATWDGGTVVHLDATGSFMESLALGQSLADIDLDPSGLLAIGARFDTVWLTDTAFSFTTEIQTNRWNEFVTFVPGSGGTSFRSLCDPGVGGVIACPCSNPPAGSNRGCDNSATTGGAILLASGGTNLSSDSLAFTTSGEKPTALSIVMQGNGSIPGGVVYGQGVRCVGGTIIRRLFIKSASGGSITAPDFSAGDPPVSVRSAAKGDVIQPGQSRWYLVYYRDPIVLGGCPATSAFNATQTGQVTWSP